MFSDANTAKVYLASVSAHPGRPGDTSNMNPDFAIRLANSVQQARAQGLNVGVESGFREPGVTGSRYDAGGNSSHSYGLASDVNGLDGPNGAKTNQWAQIAGANGLHNPYGVGNNAEFNHWQLPPQPLERTPDLLNKLQAAKATGNFNNVYAAYSQGATPTVAGGGATPVPGDNRQMVFDALTKPENQGGAGLSPQQALGAIWGLAGESHATLQTTAYNAADPGGSIGMGQWNGIRRTALEAFAKQSGKSVNDPQLQTDYLVSELLGSHRNVLTALQQAPDAAAATHIWVKQFEVPKVDNSEQRIAQGSHVGGLDTQGKFVAGDAKPIATTVGGGATPGGAAGGTATPTTPSSIPLTPTQSFDMSLGSTLASLGSTGGGSSAPPEVPDQPAIRTLAAEMPGPQAPSPVPQKFEAGVGSIGADLGQLAAQPAADAEAANVAAGAPSITAGAPSMTAMLNPIGTSAEFNYLDPRRTTSPSLTMRQPRLA